MLDLKLNLKTPGLFVTATDTAVGKTIVSCAIAHALLSQSPQDRIAAFKPLASECDLIDGEYVNPDTAALHHFTNKRHPLTTINPVRFVPPLAPGVASAEANEPVNWNAVRDAIQLIDQDSDKIIVEGAGGLLVPLDGENPHITVLDLAAAMGYPVLIVTRATLGTLNHTSMTIRLLQERGLKVAGIVMNHYQGGFTADDPSIALNRAWLEKMNGIPIITEMPAAAPELVTPNLGRIDSKILDHAASINWSTYFAASKPLV
ncbi:ATP-dependent dethiobiotin synthetase BioD 1 [Poriferisphaera corsica]|uniref:ATP-dependent dethiobiotin synthetase BioD n=1 Tax=Poriferisphaera corsica TaxID=2528020 RepID=A0A517YWQ2_9BACT|nr:dethiobiotin synthase [Poriferisphaera corsica]QDU34627.1 ATP-dependent dethiobiotin synthetase BioD 1 [Poriferisphaera corsica]